MDSLYTSQLGQRLSGLAQNIDHQHGLILEGRLTRVVGMTLEAIGIDAPVGAHCYIRNHDGELVEADEVEQVVKLLADLPRPPPAVRRLQLWSHPFTAALLVLMLATFWIWRRAAGLI